VTEGINVAVIGAGLMGLVDNEAIAPQVRDTVPAGFDKVLELISTRTLKNSLQCSKQRGIVCMTGIVRNAWSFDAFAPMEAIPSAVYLTSYSGNTEDFMQTPLDLLAQQIVAESSNFRLAGRFTWTRSLKHIA
jgi:D-arabinose 1-dehydrogenase-like Zn-dependent alcohol dehydrogenase